MGKSRVWLKTRGGRVVSYFLQGLLLLSPIFVTLYAVFYIFNLLDSSIERVYRAIFNFYFPSFGIITMFFIIAIIGYFGSLVIAQPLLHFLDEIFERTPLVKDIYSSLKDFFGAFMSKKKKFDKPVLFEWGKGTGVFKLGFITQDDLTELKIKDKVAVYAPLSYNLSGILYIVNKDQIQVLNDIGAGHVMKFVMSGGVTEIEEDYHSKSTKLESS